MPMRDSMILRAVDELFGYDFFLSYSHADGANYPIQTKDELEKTGFRVFLDRTEYVPGIDLRRETRRQVRKSRKIVVIGRSGAFQSVWVAREVEQALSQGKIPIIINVNGALHSAIPDSALAARAQDEHWLLLEESLEKSDGSPSDRTISELIRSFASTRQETKRLRILTAVAATFALVCALAVWQAVRASRQTAIAEARELAASAAASLDADPERSLILGLYSLARQGEMVPGLSQVLHDAATASHARRTMQGHEGPVEGVSWSPDGKRLATASEDKTAQVWDISDGRSVLTLRGHEAEVQSVAWSRDGSRLATASRDRTARVWDAADGRPLLTMRGHRGEVWSVAWSPDGKITAQPSGTQVADEHL
jgi:hypothetical protein